MKNSSFEIENGKFRDAKSNRLDVFIGGELEEKLAKIASQLKNERMYFDFAGNEIERGVAMDMDDNEKSYFHYNANNKQICLVEF